MIWLGLAFAVLYHLITMLFAYGGFEFELFFQDRLAEGKWIRFLAGTFFSAFIYGFIISYGLFRSKIRKQDKN